MAETTNEPTHEAAGEPADEATAEPATGPLRLLGSATAGYCDPVTGLCVLPAADPEQSVPDQPVPGQPIPESSVPAS
jgi:hypothetical protein